MRHRVAGKQLGRNHNERQLLLKGLLLSFLTYGKIKTTSAKITSVRPLISRSLRHIIKSDRLTASRFLGRQINSRSAIKSILDRFQASYEPGVTPGLSVVKVKRRVGDDALISEISLNPPLKTIEVKPEPKKAAKSEPKKAAPKKPISKKKVVEKS